MVGKGILGRANRPGLEESALEESVCKGLGGWLRRAARITEPVSSSRLAASLLCLASNCPLEARFDLAFLELIQGPTQCLAKHRTAYSAASETHGSVCFVIW